MRKTLLSMLAVGLLVGADQRKADDTVIRTDNHFGLWKAESMELAGKKEQLGLNKMEMTLTFDKDQLTIQEGGRKQTATYKADLSKKPAHIDIMPTEGPQKGKAQKMIFQVEGNKLRIGGGDSPDAERPKSFDQKDIMIITLTREKK